MAVSMMGVTPVRTTLRMSIPTGTPSNPKAGMRYVGCVAMVISRISRLRRMASSGVPTMSAPPVSFLVMMTLPRQNATRSWAELGVTYHVRSIAASRSAAKRLYATQMPPSTTVTHQAHRALLSRLHATKNTKRARLSNAAAAVTLLGAGVRRNPDIVLLSTRGLRALSWTLQQLVQGLDQIRILLCAEAELQFEKARAQGLHLIGHIDPIHDDLFHQRRQFGEVLLLHAEPRHLRDPQAQAPCGREALLAGNRLVVADDVVLFEPAGDLRALGVADMQYHLMRLREVDVWIAGYDQAALMQGPGERLGVGNDLGLVLILEVVHLKGSHEQAQQRTQVVVGERPGKRPVANPHPEVVAVLVGLVAAAHHATLCAEVRLVGRPRHEVGPLLKRPLEMRPDETQHMGHVVHHHRRDLLGVEVLPDLGDRLFVEDQALAEDDQFGPVSVDQVERFRDIDLVRVLGKHWEVDDGRPLGLGIACHEGLQGAHRLDAEVASLSDVVVHHPCDASRFSPAIGAVDVVDHGAEHGRIRHLPADQPQFDFRAAHKQAHLLLEPPLDL